MLALAVVGAAVFLRYSLARFLRFWLLRQLYEGQAHIDQVVAALGERDGVGAPSDQVRTIRFAERSECGHAARYRDHMDVAVAELQGAALRVPEAGSGR